MCYIKLSTAYQKQKHQRFYIIIHSFSCSLLNIIFKKTEISEKFRKIAILVTSDTVGPYPGLPDEDGLNAQSGTLMKPEDSDVEKFFDKTLLKTEKFVLKFSFFEFNSKLRCQYLTAIRNKYLLIMLVFWKVNL